MAFGKNKSGTDTKNMTKADVILQREAEIIKRQNDLSAKVDKLLASDEQHSANHSADNEELIKRVAQENAYLGKQSTEIYEQLKKENAALRKEFNYISTQTENVYSKLSEDNAAKTDDLFSRMSAELAYMTAQITGAFESLDKKVEEYNAALNEKIDALSKAFEDGIAVREEEPEEALDDEQLSIEEEYFDYDELAVRIADRLAESNLVDSDAVAEKIASLVNVAEIDYDELAYKIADSIPPQEAVSADDIASRVAEQLVIPEAEDAEYEELADESAEEITEPAEEYAAIDAEALANDIAHKVSELTNDEFDIVLDDAGCDSLAAAVVQKLDYDMLADKIAQRIATEKLSEDHSEFDYDIVLDEEGLRMITDSLTAELVSVCGSEFDGVNGRLDEANEKLDEILGKEDAIYTEAASNGNGVSEVKQDVEEIKEILAAGVVLAQEETAATTAEALEEEPEEEIAEEQPVEEIAEEPAEEAVEETAEEVAEEPAEEAAEEPAEEAAEEPAEEVTEEPAEEVTEEPAEEIAEEPAEEVTEEPAEEPAEEAAEEIAEEPAEETAEEVTEEPAEEAAEEIAEEPVEEPAEEEEEELIKVSDIVDEDELESADDSIAELLEDVDEQTAPGEVIPDGIEGISNEGVDFANMMKYNRSFIARIIQGSDDVKNYYGQVKNAMLSYKKVNSSIAWGAERFNKGRETIAKFKIRGKTLCLYLNLDPKEYKTSVYHHVDVSDNKSMHGTPMMVKIKSPLGVKKAIRLIDEMLAKRNGEKRTIQERDYAAMYPYETIEELIEDGLVKDVSKK